jgi:hypothetical protein
MAERRISTCDSGLKAGRKKLYNEDLYNPNSLPDIIYEIEGDHM